MHGSQASAHTSTALEAEEPPTSSRRPSSTPRSGAWTSKPQDKGQRDPETLKARQAAGFSSEICAACPEP